MRHAFVETNWVFDYAAPAHHKGLDAVALLERARRNELQLHIPAICLTEARHAIMNKCQPRSEAKAIREFLNRAKLERTVSPDQDRATREVLFLFERQVQSEIAKLDEVLAALHAIPSLEQFALSERMLDRSISLAGSKLFLKPFDQAILAAILVRAQELQSAGETDVCLCEMDSDLQPWTDSGRPKQPLTSFYDEAGLWVYGGFDMTAPERPHNWPGSIPPGTR